MGKRSTLFKIVFFSLLLAGLIAMQYMWIQGMQKEKLQLFRGRAITGIEQVSDKICVAPSLNDLADTTFAKVLGQSFFSNGLGKLAFEYAINLSDCQLASRGYNENKTQGSKNLILHYTLRRTGESNREGIVTVVIPFYKKIALKDMTWIIVASVFLTLTIAGIFYSVSFFAGNSQRDTKTIVLTNMMQQLESPLSSVSVAAEALRNAKVKHDAGKINYYQQVITQESQRMNEQVEKFLKQIEK